MGNLEGPDTDFDVPVTTTGCPACGAAPGEVSWQLAPGQYYCPNSDCSVNTWGGSAFQ